MNQSLQYRPTEEDEVEDLFLLLKEVKVGLSEVLRLLVVGSSLTTFSMVDVTAAVWRTSRRLPLFVIPLNF